MRTPIVLILALGLAGCAARGAADRHLDQAYRHYAAGDCHAAGLALSQAERRMRRNHAAQPEISLLRGHCLEREKLYVDAAQTYRFIVERYPASEYAYRARARLDTLRQLGHLDDADAAVKVVPLAR